MSLDMTLKIQQMIRDLSSSHKHYQSMMDLMDNLNLLKCHQFYDELTEWN